MPSHVPALIAEHIRATRGPEHRVGPFAVGLDGHSDDPMRNFAVPDSGACPTAAEVDALVVFFRQHHKIPRLARRRSVQRR
jgi:hypothetical protein